MSLRKTYLSVEYVLGKSMFYRTTCFIGGHDSKEDMS